jgi:hypothetical protein
MLNGFTRWAAAQGPTFPHWCAAFVGFVLVQWWLLEAPSHGYPAVSHEAQFVGGVIGALAFGWGWEGIIRLFRLLKGSAPSKPPEHGTGQ